MNHKQTPVPPENWIVIRGTHEPIISYDIFEAVKAFREQVAEKAIQRGKVPYTENIFKGKIFCACCGKSLHKQRCKRKKGPDRFIYHCISNDWIAKGTCEGAFIYEDELRSVVLAILQKRIEVVIGKNLFLQKNKLTLKSRQDIDKNRRF